MKPTKITIHCTVTPNDTFYDISKIDEYHKSLGWKGVGYHMVIQPDGEVQHGRGFNEIGAHVKGANNGSGINLGVALIGTDKFTELQFAVLRYQIRSISALYGISPSEIYTHSQFESAIKDGKKCPNMTINDLLVWYLLEDDRVIEKYLI